MYYRSFARVVNCDTIDHVTHGLLSLGMCAFITVLVFLSHRLAVAVSVGFCASVRAHNSGSIVKFMAPADAVAAVTPTPNHAILQVRPRVGTAEQHARFL